MFYLHQSHRVEGLVGSLAAVLGEPMVDPMASEWLVVQNQGMAAWLQCELATRLGIMCNVRLPFPRSFFEAVLRLTFGEEVSPLGHFQRDELTWTIMSLFDELADDESFGELVGYWRDDVRGIKKYQVASRIGKLFDDYVVYRPEMIRDWERGPVHQTDRGSAWQSMLWRRIVERHGSNHLATVMARFSSSLAAGLIDTGRLPERVLFFGINSIPPLYLSFLAELSRAVSVHFFHLSPSREFWATIRGKRDIVRDLASRQVDREAFEEELALQIGNPLLASFGQLGRDFQYLLEDRIDYLDGVIDYDSEEEENRCLLTTLQADILSLRYRRRGGEHGPERLVAGDESLTITVCHSRLREIEVLHDSLRALFERDPTLKPHDIVVLAPDISVYSSLIAAVFGRLDPEDSGIPFTIVENRRQGDVFDAFLAMLSLAKSRVTVEEVFDLLGRDSVSRRFRLSPESLDQVRHWAEAAGIRWGIDEQHRRETGQPSFEENSWRFGLDRLLLGAALPATEATIARGIRPYDEIEGSDTGLLGQFVQAAETIFTSVRGLRTPRTCERWSETLRALLAQLIDAERTAEYQVHLLNDMILKLAETSRDGQFRGEVSLDVIIEYLTTMIEKTDIPLSRSMTRTTFASFAHMRGIPFRVVCLLGINEGEFPRQVRPDSFDLMVVRPKHGDRSARHDDRYLFLEAIMMARERLIISHIGRSVSDNSVIPPSVLISELIDAIIEGFVTPDVAEEADIADRRRSMERFLLREHMLQPFSPRYFQEESGLYSYRRDFCQTARILAEGTGPRRAFLDAAFPLPETMERIVTLNDLVDFYRSPARSFLRHRFGLDFRDSTEESSPREPILLNNLEQYSLGTELLTSSAAALTETEQRFRSAGKLPAGVPGRCAVESVLDVVRSISLPVGRLTANTPLEPLNVDIGIGSTRLIGQIDHIRRHGRLLVSYSQFRARSLLDLWIRHMAMTIVAPNDYPRESRLISRQKPKNVKISPLHHEVTLPDMGRDAATVILTDLIDLYWSGLQQPLPFFPGPSYTYALALFSGKTPPEPDFLEIDSDYSTNRSRFRQSVPEEWEEEASLLFAGENGWKPRAGYGFIELARRVYEPLLKVLSAELPASLADDGQQASGGEEP